jgi:hypothetical protein
MSTPRSLAAEIPPRPAPFSRLRRAAVNGLIAAVLLLVLIDAAPQSPLALRLAIQPVVQRIGINQEVWGMFTPNPDSINIRWQVEVTYADGKTAEWRTPEWRKQSLWQRFIRQRHQEYCDMLITQDAAPAYEDAARYFARTLRPDLKHADRGATVKITYEEATVPPAAQKPWTTWREPPPYANSWTLTIERLP